MSVTIKEIAKKTGLSIPTVGNVLGRSASRYSEATRVKVREAAKTMGYRPNSSARAMRQGKIGCAALVLSRTRQQTHSHIPQGLLDGIDDELNLHDMHLAVTRLTDEELSQHDFVPKVLREYMADGMIVNYTHGIPPEMLDLIHAHHTPAVWLNAKLGEDCVYPDDLRAAMLATQRLIEIGHRRIAFVHLIPPGFFTGTFAQNWPGMHYSVHDRDAGYREAMRNAGLTPRIVKHDNFVDEGQEQSEALRAMLTGEDRATAVLVYSDHDVSLLMCIAAELGLSIPKDLSVLTFFPTEPWIGGRHISSVRVPTAEMGRRAVRMLLKKITVPEEPCAPEPVMYEAVFGETVAPLLAD
jgi:LacI family transcriptional regulator